MTKPKRLRVSIQIDDEKPHGYEYDLESLESVVRKKRKEGVSELRLSMGLLSLTDDVSDAIREDLIRALYRRYGEG